MSTSNIVLWGPSGSGKTWFINAFAKSLEKYNEIDDEFSYELLEDGFPIDNIETPEPEPTQELRDKFWLFSRKGRGNTKAHKISSYTHRMVLTDDKGTNTVSASSGNNRSIALSFTSEKLKAANYIILMLDPLTVIDAESSTDDATAISRENYAKSIQNLTNLLREYRKERFIAVCLTKADQLGGLGVNSEQLIGAIFGTNLLHVLHTYKNQPNVHMKMFTVSSMGYLDGPGRYANYEPQTGYLAKREHWFPYNVEFPFFWLFESIERRRLEESPTGFISKILNDPLNNYIPYPHPKW